MKSQTMLTIALDHWTSRSTEKRTRRLIQILSALAGIAFLALLAQISIHLPFTPVPITGQTLGVLLIGLTFGRTLGVMTVLGYLAAGAAGLPIFAGGLSGLTMGPTLGYLIGMVVSAAVVGTLADRGVTKRWRGLVAACLLSSALIYACGLAVLSRFVPSQMLLMSGFYPFVAGDIFKTAIAVGLIGPTERLVSRG